jgi:hypothetical protein
LRGISALKYAARVGLADRSAFFLILAGARELVAEA